MKLMPTLEGGLRIEIETPADWMVLEHIQYDALDGGEDRLPQRLGALMDEQSEWEEVVIPELKSLFNGQVSCVVKGVTRGQEGVEIGAEKASGEVRITKEDAENWYGALNQARLALEAKYKFGQSEEIEDLEGFPDEKRSAFVRNQFYNALQGVLLDYVLE
jgi:hypothetical protein